ncbi:MAG: hypothetical protein WBW33_22810 [Bryobacteraceae bacterium]
MKLRLLLAVLSIPVLCSLAFGQATLTGSPNPFTVDANGLGQITLTWSAPAASNTEVRVNSATGPIFAAGGPTGSAETGLWVTDGMQFFLQDVSAGEPGTTLTTYTAQAGLPGLPAGTNILISSNNGQQLTYSVTGASEVEIHLNTPTGTLLARLTEAEGTVNTGPWVTNGMRFYLQDVSGGNPLTYQHTLATAVATVIPSFPGTPGVVFGATPGIAPDPTNTGASTASLYWNAPGTANVEVHVGTADGPLFAAAGGNGFYMTGDWVTDGMQFYLQNASAGNATSPANTLAITTVDVQSALTRYLAANDGKDVVSVFNSSSGQPITQIFLPAGAWALDMHASPDGNGIYVLGTDGNYYIADPLTSSITGSINLSKSFNGGPVPAEHFTWIQDATAKNLILATDSSGLVSIVDPTAGALVKTLSCQCALGPGLVFSPYNLKTYIPEAPTSKTPDANLIVVVNASLAFETPIAGPTYAGSGTAPQTAFENITVVQSGLSGALVLQLVSRDTANPFDTGAYVLYSYDIASNTFYDPNLVKPASTLLGFGPHLYLQVANQVQTSCCSPVVFEPFYGSIFSYQVVYSTSPGPKFELEGSADPPSPGMELLLGPVATDPSAAYLSYAQAYFGQNGYVYQSPIYIYKADPVTLQPSTSLMFLNSGAAPGLADWTLGSYTFTFPTN